MRSSIAVCTALVCLGAAPLHAQSAREAVYYTTASNLWRATLNTATPTSAIVATDAGTSLRGLTARYDGNGAVTLLAANQTKTGGVRAFSCPSSTGACTALGAVASLKYARSVALDTNGNAYAVNEDLFGSDQLLYVPRNLACSANPSAAGCLPGGYAAPVVIDDKVDSASLLTDVKVVSGVGSLGAGAKYGPGDVLVLVERPARLLAYSHSAIAAYLAGTGPRPVPTLVTSDFDCEEPESFGVFATGELIVATARGRLLVFRTTGERQATPFVDLHDEAVGLSLGVEGGSGADPLTGGRVLVTLHRDNRLVSLGLTRNGSGELVAPAGGPAHSLLTQAAFGVGDASVAGSVYTPASAGPLVVDLTSHEITFEKLNSGGYLSGNYYVISETSVRAAHDTACPNGKLTVEGVTRCVPWFARGYPLGTTTPCSSDGSGCYYLVFSADTGANLFGGTQEHHFEEAEFGFATACYVSALPGAGPDPRQPRTFWATDDNDPTVIEDDDFSDISTGCNSHIGRGGQFSLFLTGWDARKLRDIVTTKLENLERALNGCDAARGGLASYIDPALLGSSRKKNTLAYWLDKAEDAWRCKNVAGTEAALDSFLALIRANPDKFFAQPTGLPARNTPGELIARGESAWFLSCGAKESCQRRLTP